MTISFSFTNTGKASKFNMGDSVRTTANLNVRSGPELGYSIIKTEPKGTTGVVLDGPVNADGHIWWKVKYGGGVTGWSAENWLEKV